ncbi:MAG TPA: NAD(P)/FAD-dependent oxidoreductase [Gemmatimonadota bacterium]|nr:NAD(P)/FAD-dependent oxidoreductase [Gemmatimonadota bacterium]
MRTLIVGAGVAGLTLTALLRQRGREPVLVHRAESFDELGYMLGLYHLGSRVLHGLDLFEAARERAVLMRRYEIYDGDGRLLHGYDLEELTRRFGSPLGISRPSHMEILLERVGRENVRTGTTVQALEQGDGEVRVRLSDGTSGTFDLVVAADGLHSDTRGLILDEDEHAYGEYWGAGRFVGIYPTGDGLGVFLGGPDDEIRDEGPRALLDRLRDRFRCHGSDLADVLDAVEPGDDPLFWDFHDGRSEAWRKGRVVLLGDAAAGFLPTAGIGASMAMESAAALADELSRTNDRFLEAALDLFEKRRRSRVESAQDSSRELGRMMFVGPRALAWGHDQLVKAYSLERLIRGIADLVEKPV